MKRSKNFLISIVLVLICGFLFIDSEAKIKETVEDFNGNTYIIGSTKFDNDTIITAGRAAQAGSDDAAIRYMKNQSLERIVPKIYLYNERAETWFEVPEDEEEDLKILTEEEIEELEENLNIYFVNNEEKKLEFEYPGDIDPKTIFSSGSLSGVKVTYENGKLYIPVTTTDVWFEDSNGEEIYITTEYDDENDETKLGDFYIPLKVKVLDENGNELNFSLQVEKDGSISSLGSLFNYYKSGYELYYVDSKGEEIDFDTWKVTENTSIKQAWHPIGNISTENHRVEYIDNVKYVIHDGVIHKKTDGYYLNINVYAPKDYDTTNTLVNGKNVSFTDGMAQIEIPVTGAGATSQIVVEWEEGEEVTFNLKVSESVYYTYTATFYDEANEVIRTIEKISSKNTISQPDIVLTKENKVFAGWTTDVTTNELFDFNNTTISDNIEFYPVFMSLVEFIKNSESEESPGYYYATLPSDLTLTETAVLDFDGDITLNLADHKITATDNHAIRLKGNDTILHVNEGTFETTGAGAALAIGTNKEDASGVTRRILNVNSNVIINAETYGIVTFGKSELNFQGIINISGDGYGIAGNGNDNNEGTLYNIEGTIKAPNGAAIYQPQEGTTNIIDGIYEAHTIMGIKAGNLTVYNGSFTATGTPAAPQPSGNGFDLTGDIFLAEENAAYADHIVIDIQNGTFDTSNGGAIVREYNPSIGTENERTVTVRGLYATRKTTDLENVFEYVDSNIADLEVNQVRYTSKDLGLAIEQSSSDNNLNLLNDITLTETALVDADKDMYFNLNGHTIYASDNHAIRLKGNNSSLTVDNGYFETTGSAAALAIGTNKEDASGVAKRVLNVESNVVINAETYGIVTFGKSELNFRGSINVSGDGYGIAGNGNENNEGTIYNIEGTITAPNGAAIYQPQQGDTYIYDGSNLNAHTVMGIKAGNLTVYNGSFTATGTPAAPQPSGNGFDLTGDIFLAEENEAYADHIVIDIQNGTFDTSNGGAIVREYNPSIGTENERTVTVRGLYATRKTTDLKNVFEYIDSSLAEIQLKAIGYTSNDLKFIIENSDEYNPAVLLNNILLADTVVVEADKDMFLDLNSFSIVSNDVHAIRLKGNNSSLTVNNGSFTTTGAGAALAIGTNKEDASGVTKRVLNVESNVEIISDIYGIVTFGKSELNFRGSIAINGDGYGIAGNGNKNNEGTIYNIEGNITALNGAAIYQPQEGTTNIIGGTFEAHTIMGIKAGNLNVSGGVFIARGTPAAPQPSGDGFDLTGDIFLAEENAAYADHIIIDIQNGTFDTSNGGAIVREFNPSLGTENERTVTVKGLYPNRIATDNQYVFVYEANN